MPTAFTNALLVLPDGVPFRGTLRFDQKQILSVDNSPQCGDMIRDLSGFAVYPGLVNAHDHLELNHYPRTKFREVYTDAAEWSADFSPKLDTEPFAALRKMPLVEQCRIGALKNLRSGVTTVAHHNPPHKPLFDRSFPVRVVRRYGWAHSFALEERNLQATFRQKPPGAPWFIHLAEGTGSQARSELDQLDRLGLLTRDTVLIHGVGLSAADRTRIIETNAALVWCPSTNFYLLGETAQARGLAHARRLAIGSDSRLTADGDLLDELRAAAGTGQLTPLELFRAVTSDAAQIVHEPRAGSLIPGNYADFFIVNLTPAMWNDPSRALLDLTGAAILETWCDGKHRPKV